MRWTAVVALVLGVAATEATAQQKPPEVAIGEMFCLAKDFPAQAGPIMLVTPSLAAEIRKATARNDEIARAHPDEKPPLGDGVPYQSFPDVTPKCEVGAVEGAGPGAVVEIRHRFPGTPSADYIDRLVLGEGWNAGTLGIDDILYGAGGGSLRGTLAEMFE